ncbi:MAG: hypothetical protein J3R72DRAFT_424465 [Linnemannia gamsii]|nr:MAG: hypothetical protein J3R72DRAFT_424465 [Linnemannia gamsii]
MKFIILIAPIAAMAVSIFALPSSNAAIATLPTSNNILRGRQDGTNVSLNNEALCNNTTLTWKILIKERKFYFNAFEFRVKYHDSSITDYVAYMIIGGMSNEINEKKECYIDGNWCVTYSGRDVSDKVTVHFAHQELPHRSPDWRIPVEGFLRDDYQYFDCVLW